MSNTLTEGDFITVGQSLVSNNGTYTMSLQSGNFVLSSSTNSSMWTSKTTTGTKVIMQSNGYLQVLDAGGKMLWQNATSGGDGGFFILQNDGNAVVYKQCSAWATNTQQG